MEPLVHFVVPFVALMLAGVEFRKALPVSLLALLPDLDALFLVHRSLSHSVVVIFIVIAPFLLLTYKFKPRVHGYALLALMTVVSHPILDVFAGYTPVLWPLYGYSVWIKTELVAHIGSSPSLLPSAQLLMEPTSFQPFQGLDAPLLTGGGLIISVVLLLPVLLRFSKAVWQQIRELATR
ncbi:MAG: metal-dependent hydrolase [Candidatus Bathyarchaeia archaeon]